MLRKKLEALCKDPSLLNVKIQNEENKFNNNDTTNELNSSIPIVNSEQLNNMFKNFDYIEASNTSLKQFYTEMDTSKFFISSKPIALILLHFEEIFEDIYAIFTDKEGTTIGTTLFCPCIELEVGSIYVFKNACLVKSGIRNYHLLVDSQNIIHAHLFR